MLTYLIKDLKPITGVDSAGFRFLLEQFNPRFKLPTKNYFRDNLLPQVFEEVKAQIKIELGESIERYAITTDGWTSQDTVDYVTTTVHFVNSNYELKSFVLQTLPLGTQHTAENMANLMREIALDWSFRDVFAVTDNASNMVKCFQSILKWPHLGCIGHTLNLSVKKCFGVPAVSKILAKCRNVVTYFKQSTTAARNLKLKQTLLSLPHHALINDCITRWNSTLEMLERVCEQEPAICAVLMSSTKSEDRTMSFTDDEIKLICELFVVLAPFKQATVRLSAQKLATASMILPTICKLLHVLEVANDDSSAIKLVKRAIHDDLSVRYPPGPTRGFLQICSFLDPRFKGLSSLTETEVSDLLDQLSKECILLINRQISDDSVVKRECPQVSDSSTESAKSDILPSNPHIIPVPSLSSSHGDGEPVTDTLRSIVKFEANQVGPMAERSKIEHVDDFFDDVCKVNRVLIRQLSDEEKVKAEILNYYLRNKELLKVLKRLFAKDTLN